MTTRMSWFVYVVRLAADIDRKRVMAALEEQGVPSRP
jgi:dTDP-4-amino-4,6-dideoxygalactose transaminase